MKEGNIMVLVKSTRRVDCGDSNEYCLQDCLIDLGHCGVTTRSVLTVKAYVDMSDMPTSESIYLQLQILTKLVKFLINSLRSRNKRGHLSWNFIFIYT